jgi:hypothetical protein
MYKGKQLDLDRLATRDVPTSHTARAFRYGLAARGDRALR